MGPIKVLLSCFHKLISAFVLTFVCASFAQSQSITIKGTQFFVDSTHRIWFTGVNTPWHSWNDFGGSFDRNWWNSHFQLLKNQGINCSRIWISCDGNGAIKTSSNGVTGVSSTFYKDCDTLFAIAKRYGIIAGS